MKNFFVLGILVLISSSVFAKNNPVVPNASDGICSVSGTSIQFDLSTNSPPTEGSRFFHGITLTAIGDLANPDLTINYDSSQYIIWYADGRLDDGAGYFVLNITDRNNSDNSLYAFTRNATPQNSTSQTKTAAFSEFRSSLPGLIIPDSANATFNCE